MNKKQIVISLPIAVSVVALVMGLAIGLTSNTSTNTPSSDTPTSPMTPLDPSTPSPDVVKGQVYSPYADVTLLKNSINSDRYSQLTDFMANGVENITAAFFTQNSKYDVPTDEWAGNIDPYGNNEPTAPDANYIKDSIDSFQARGGGVELSFGGATGTYSWNLADATGANLSSEMSKLAVYFSSTKFDFDVEGGGVLNEDGLAKLGQGIKDLAAINPNYEFTLTLPVLPTGLTAGGVKAYEIVSNNAGFPVDLNIMSMDYGPGNGEQWQESDMGQCAIDSMKNSASQLVDYLNTTTYKPEDGSDWSQAVIYKDYMADTVMIGQNDVLAEVFGFSDVSNWLKFTQDNDMHGIRFWSLTRDYPGKEGTGLPISTEYPDQTIAGEFTQKIARVINEDSTKEIEGTLTVMKYAVSIKQIVISWTSSDLKYALSYDVYQKASGASDFSLLKTTGSNSFTNTVVIQSSYQYKIVARNLGNSTVTSNTVSVSNTATNLFENVATKYNPNVVYLNPDEYIAYDGLLYRIKYYYNSSDGTPDKSDACEVVTKITNLDQLSEYGYSSEAIAALK